MGLGDKRESAQSDGGSLTTALGTPASSRRNTDEARQNPRGLQQQASVDSLVSASDTISSTVELGVGEMPPVSPFFARVSFADIADARETVRRASLRHSLARTASPDGEGGEERSGRMSLAEISRALASVFDPTGDQPIQKKTRRRWFRVNVFGLLTAASQDARIEVTEIGDDGERPVDLNDPDVRRALRRYPMVLAMGSRQQKQSTSQTPVTRMRAPKQLKKPLAFSLPALSFTVSSMSSTGADRSVRAIDVGAMAAAYLPRVHAMLNESEAPLPTADDRPRTPSQSSTATLADSLRLEAPTEIQQPKPRSLLRRPRHRSDIGLTNQKSEIPSTIPRLRSSASVMNLRGLYSELSPGRLSGGSTTASISQIAMPPTPARPSLIGQPVSRRRSEVQALITQANAVMSRSRSPPVDSPSSTLPRASFPLYSAPSLGGDPSISGLRAALSRQQHRLEPARSSDHRQQLRHSSSSSDT
ncbi:hypothetical protein GGI21_004256, partial [Coemansia aciculifera]